MPSEVFSENAMKETTFVDFSRLTSPLSLSGTHFGPVMEKSRRRNYIRFTSPRCCWKKASLPTLVRLSTSKIIGLSRELVFYTQDLAYPKATWQIAKAGQACCRRGTSGPQKCLECTGLRDHPTPLLSQRLELKTKDQKMQYLPSSDSPGFSTRKSSLLSDISSSFAVALKSSLFIKFSPNWSSLHIFAL